MLRLILTALLACASMPAHANSITGNLKVFPYAQWHTANDTITPWYGSTLPTIATGDFAPFANQATVVLQNPNETVPFSWLGTNSNLFCGTTCLFALAIHPDPVAWLNVSTITDLGWSFQGTPTYESTGTGVMTIPGFDPTLGKFDMAIQWGYFGWTVKF
jgi:hypothetical protein